MRRRILAIRMAEVHILTLGVFYLQYSSLEACLTPRSAPEMIPCVRVNVFTHFLVRRWAFATLCFARSQE